MAAVLLCTACLILAAGTAARAEGVMLPPMPPDAGLVMFLPVPGGDGWGTDPGLVPPPLPPLMPEPWPGDAVWLPVLPAPPGSEPGWLLPTFPFDGGFLWMPAPPPLPGDFPPPPPLPVLPDGLPPLAPLPPGFGAVDDIGLSGLAMAPPPPAPAETPEPATLLLVGGLLAGLAGWRRRSWKRRAL